MNSNIENDLKDLLENQDTIPFLFVGTGLSKRYINIESWHSLLDRFAKLALDNEFAFDLYKNEASKLVASNKQKLYPQIATLIEHDFNATWYKSKKYIENRNKYRDIVKSGTSPFKLEISKHIEKQISKLYDIKNENLIKEIELLKRIGEKNINGIITTNYDMLMENLFSDYKSFIGQYELIFSPLQGVGEIYKIHGCCSNPNSIIINKDDYEIFKSTNAYLSAKLLTIFLEHPVIFLGYSLNDDDVNEILLSITNCLSQEQLDTLKNRLIFVEFNRHNKPDSISTHSISFSNNKKIEMTKLFISDYSKLYSAILNSKTKSRYSVSLLRKLKKDIYELILTNDPKEKLRVVTPLSPKNDENTEYVIGVGISKKFAIKGLTGINSEDIYKDIVMDTFQAYPDFDMGIFIEDVLPEKLKQHSNSIPIYKYIYNSDKLIEDLPEKIKENFKDDYDKLLSKSIRYNRIDSTVNELREKYDDFEAMRYIARISTEKMYCDELFTYINDIFEKKPDILSNSNSNAYQKTDFRRLIKLYDWLIYYEKIKEREH